VTDYGTGVRRRGLFGVWLYLWFFGLFRLHCCLALALLAMRWTYTMAELSWTMRLS